VKRRKWIAGLAAAAAAVSALTLSLTTTAHASAQHSQTPKPTVVLVHGAWADASGWTPVIERLQQAGYTVDAPPNPLRGLTSDAQYIASVLKQVKGPVILVGHSYGGAVITDAAVGDPNVKALVYIAAWAPGKGQSLASLMPTPSRSAVRT
jgi:pimeloyl-ACP methyl ester carboxylesterase